MAADDAGGRGGTAAGSPGARGPGATAGGGELASGPARPGQLPGRIVLVGSMAAGKSAAGRELARRTGYRFVDLDEEVESRAGRSIPEIFAAEGEAGFRRREAEATRDLDVPGGAPGVVVATGGGWMARPELRDRWEDAVRVWLRVRPETALDRLEGELASRPMLDPEAPLESLRRILDRRREDYGLAEHAVATDGRTPGEVADRVLELLAP